MTIHISLIPVSDYTHFVLVLGRPIFEKFYFRRSQDIKQEFVGCSPTSLSFRYRSSLKGKTFTSQLLAGCGWYTCSHVLVEWLELGPGWKLSNLSTVLKSSLLPERSEDDIFDSVSAFFAAFFSLLFFLLFLLPIVYCSVQGGGRSCGYILSVFAYFFLPFCGFSRFCRKGLFVTFKKAKLPLSRG